MLCQVCLQEFTPEYDDDTECWVCEFYLQYNIRCYNGLLGYQDLYNQAIVGSDNTAAYWGDGSDNTELDDAPPF